MEFNSNFYANFVILRGLFLFLCQYRILASSVYNGIIAWESARNDISRVSGRSRFLLCLMKFRKGKK
ncbi:hypothetical protein BACCIP111895_04517 [Neobacillus rhizosphaerae]|uniref:Uncharacterized protein n=1 Tax=Neobacillus rhizosphaerae TaxID=2880965 RepID=A0ABM9EX98_9BACI|nr:hypothetical protein BACCIP111895_04517 [Neobacillus rhizosphaerae]